jgi:hypothetical protein
VLVPQETTGDAMGKREKYLDDLFEEFPYTFGEVCARKIEGKDGRSLVQLRIDMGILQLESTGRPDGAHPEGFDTYYDYLIAKQEEEGDEFTLDEERCLEIDREFVQFFHRRISWLALREFASAVIDADHTLALMDLSSGHPPDENWVAMHEQYRPFVMFHRTQASALVELESGQPEPAVEAIDLGLEKIRQIFSDHDAEDHFETDELVRKLLEMKQSIVDEYAVEPSLTDQLAAAIADEQYELAAEIRDKIANFKPPEV